jgi:hypothetical protein
MPTPTYTLIASSTVGSGGAANIEFTSIPSTYTDICVKLSLRSNRSSGTENINLRFNGSSSNLSSRRLTGTGSTARSDTYASNIYIEANGNTLTANTFASTDIYVPNYAGSTNKSVSADTVMEANVTGVETSLVAGLWSNTAAINQVTILPLDGTLWLQYSTAYLYGIKKD